MSDATSRLLSFSKEINPAVGYEKFSELSLGLADGHFPITEDMDTQARKVQIANRAKTLMQENVLNHDFAMEIIKMVMESSESDFDELCCF